VQYSLRMCLLPALCCSAALLLTPPTTYRLLSAVYHLRPAGCRLLPTLTTYRLPPVHAHAHAACARVLRTYRLLLHSAYVHVPLPQE
jgi:hypothetical protein